jgi:hypothetical protein
VCVCVCAVGGGGLCRGGSCREGLEEEEEGEPFLLRAPSLSPTLSLSDLPHQLLQLICAQLGPRELGRAAQTCRTMRAFGMDRELWEGMLAAECAAAKRRRLMRRSADQRGVGVPEVAVHAEMVVRHEGSGGHLMGTAQPNARGTFLRQAATSAFIARHVVSGTVRLYAPSTSVRLRTKEWLACPEPRRRALQDAMPGLVRCSTQAARQQEPMVRITLSSARKVALEVAVEEAERGQGRVDISAQILALKALISPLEQQLSQVKAALRWRWPGSRVTTQGGTVAVTKQPKLRDATSVYSLDGAVWAALSDDAREELSWMVQVRHTYPYGSPYTAHCSPAALTPCKSGCKGRVRVQVPHPYGTHHSLPVRRLARMALTVSHSQGMGEWGITGERA